MRKRYIGEVCGYVILIGLWFGLLGAVIYVAAHFVSKFW